MLLYIINSGIPQHKKQQQEQQHKIKAKYKEF